MAVREQDIFCTETHFVTAFIYMAFVPRGQGCLASRTFTKVNSIPFDCFDILLQKVGCIGQRSPMDSFVIPLCHTFYLLPLKWKSTMECITPFVIG